jgi:hypothetical protein
MRAGRTERRDVPHEPGQWVEFRTLSGRELDEAEELQTKRAMRLVEGMDLSAIRSAATTQTPEQRDSYNKDTLVKYGVIGCSECEPCSDEDKLKFDGATRDWAASVVLEMNLRPLASGSASALSSSTESYHQNSPSLTGLSSQE